MPETASRSGITQAQLSRVESIDGGSLIGMCGKRRVSKRGFGIISNARAEAKRKKSKSCDQRGALHRNESEVK